MQWHDSEDQSLLPAATSLIFVNNGIVSGQSSKQEPSSAAFNVSCFYCGKHTWKLYWQLHSLDFPSTRKVSMHGVYHLQGFFSREGGWHTSKLNNNQPLPSSLISTGSNPQLLQQWHPPCLWIPTSCGAQSVHLGTRRRPSSAGPRYPSRSRTSWPANIWRRPFDTQWALRHK